MYLPEMETGDLFPQAQGNGLMDMGLYSIGIERFSYSDPSDNASGAEESTGGPVFHNEKIGGILLGLSALIEGAQGSLNPFSDEATVSGEIGQSGIGALRKGRDRIDIFSVCGSDHHYSLFFDHNVRCSRSWWPGYVLCAELHKKKGDQLRPLCNAVFPCVFLLRMHAFSKGSQAVHIG